MLEKGDAKKLRELKGWLGRYRGKVFATEKKNPTHSIFIRPVLSNRN